MLLTKRDTIRPLHGVWALVCAVSLSVFAPVSLVAQGCMYAPCDNPVPCAHCNGTWTDDGGSNWTVASASATGLGTYNVSGSVTTPHPVAGCPTITYTVTGSLTLSSGGITQIYWLAGSPSPSTSCGGYTPVSSMTYRGEILNNGCDMGNGTWENSRGAKGNFDMTKPPDLPDYTPAETTVPVGWSSQWPTVQQWRQTLQASTNFTGRQVLELPAYGADGCWFPGSIFAPYYIDGSGWFVGYWYFDNLWGDDYVGVAPAAATYYRTQGRAPCSAYAPQDMQIYVQDVNGSQSYFQDVVGFTIDFATVSSHKAGQSQVVVYWP